MHKNSVNSSMSDIDLSFLPAIYDILKCAEQDNTHDITQKVNDLKAKFQKARDEVEQLSGIDFSLEEQLRQIQVLQQQLIMKQEILLKYKDASHVQLTLPTNQSNGHMK